MNTGCDVERIPTRNYTATNAPPSRYKVESVDYYTPEGIPPNFAIITFKDTEGTNLYLFIESEKGISTPIVIPQSVKQAEDWRTK